MGKLAFKWKLIIALTVVGITGAIGALLAQQYSAGSDKTHTYGIDFGKYISWVAVFGFVFAVGFIATIAMMKKSGKTIKNKKLKIGMAVVFFIGISFVIGGAFSALRAWKDNSQTSAITVTDGTDGDFIISDPKVESYHNADGTYLDNFPYVITFDDAFRITVNLNCSNFSDGQEATAQFYNDTTIKARGFNILKQAVTGWYAPDTQPDDFEVTEETPKFVVFSDLPRNGNDPSQQIAYYQINLYDDAGEILATWYVITSPDLTAWSLGTTC